MKQGRETTFEERVRTWTLRFEQMGEAGLQDRRGQRKKGLLLRQPVNFSM